MVSGENMNEWLIPLASQMNLKSIVPSGQSQLKKVIYCLIYLYDIQEKRKW